MLTCSAPFLIDEKVFPPLGLMTVGTALRVQGHEVVIRDSPDDSTCFGIGPTTPEYGDAVRMLQQIKSAGKANRVVIGGPHAAANPEECLADGFDVVALGDGENITADTFGASGVVDLGRRPLHDYPIADRSLVDIRSYRYEIAGRLATTLVTSRGCPYHCGFCAKMEGRLRYYPLDRVAREIAYLDVCWGYPALMIFDDTFILQRRRVEVICSVLERRSIAWRCFVRGDVIVRHGPELVDVMANSGCVEVGIGIESGSDRILETIHKGETVGVIREAIGMLRQAGIRVKGLFIVGLPGEDRESLAQTRRFIEEVPLDDADFTIYQPYRGSPIWNNRHNYDIQWDIEWDDVLAGERFYKGRRGEYRCLVRTSSLSADDIVQARDGLEALFKETRR